MAATKSAARQLTNHDEIRRWAQERDAKPACVRRTGGGNDIGVIRLDFPGYTGEGSLDEISWNDWFQKFDESNLALLVQEQTARGQKSNFNKLVSRGPAEQRGRDGGRATRRSSLRGSKRSETSNPQSASSRDDFGIGEEVDVEGTSRSGSRGKHQARRSASSRSRKGRAVAARRASSSARGQRLRRTIARGSSSKRSSARRTSSRTKKANTRSSRPNARSRRGSSRGLQIVGKKSARRARGARGASGHGRGGGRRAA
ncbi:MAG TPA: hypothetical protein VJS37_02610 [Terriglobales bacterium]|nr:hypothetical protein [Terriglobales bacterium]